jgi:hypothetical protein
MLHSANALLGDGQSRSALRQPRGFHMAEGVRSAEALERGPFSSTPKGKTPAQKAGLAYEAKVHEHLQDTFAESYRASQWYSYIDGKGARRFCQPDGVLHLGSMAVIFEVKIRFTADAWWQLRRLYSSVVLCALKPKLLGLCLVTRSYDPSVPFPEAHELHFDVERWVIRRQFAEVGVIQWKP